MRVSSIRDECGPLNYFVTHGTACHADSCRGHSRSCTHIDVTFIQGQDVENLNVSTLKISTYTCKAEPTGYYSSADRYWDRSQTTRSSMLISSPHTGISAMQARQH